MPDILHVTYEAQIETLTPIHIGSGALLVGGHDLVSAPDATSTYRVDQNRVLESKQALYEHSQDEEMMTRLLGGVSSGDLLSPGDYGQHPEFFRYVLRGESPPSNQLVSEQMKDAFDGVYLAGSTLKGALRTSLFWASFQQPGAQPPSSRSLGRDRRYAGQPLERRFFGSNPNRDWLRALQVGDCYATGTPHPLDLRRAGIYRSHAPWRGSTPIWMETIRPGARFEGTVAIAQYGLRNEVARHELDWGSAQRWLADLVRPANAMAHDRIEAERRCYADCPALAEEYQGLAKQLESLGPDECLLRVGFGGGWENKTLGYGLIHQDDVEFERLVTGYGMSQNHLRRPGDPFPLTRTLLREGDAFVAPLGWIRLRLTGYVSRYTGPDLEASAFPIQTPRAEASPSRERTRGPAFRTPGGQRPEDLVPGAVLEGVVRNTARFGAFVDIGVGTNGLCHISELEKGRVDRVEDVVGRGQRVRVRVLKVECQDGKWRIGLSMIGVQQPDA